MECIISSLCDSHSSCAFTLKFVNLCELQNCLVVDVTLLDKQRKPILCMSSPVCMRSACPSDFLQRGYSFEYMGTEGGVRADLGWIEDTSEYFIVSLDFYLSLATINR